MFQFAIGMIALVASSVAPEVESNQAPVLQEEVVVLEDESCEILDDQDVVFSEEECEFLEDEDLETEL